MFKISLFRVSIAAVWLYQGFWCKVLGRAHQAGIVASVPGINPSFVMPAIGAAECALAIWVLSGKQRRLAAAAQTVLLAAMNGLGILWAARLIADPIGMLLQN